MRRVPREWAKYQYLDPQKILVGLREIARNYPLHELHYHLRTLRTHKLRKYGEGRQAALFCYGMSQALGTKVVFAHVERQDYDIVAAYELEGEMNFVPVQLKEWAPDFFTSPQSLQAELDKLAKYGDSSDLVVAFHLNRETRVLLSELSLPRSIGGLWFYGCTEPQQNCWTLIGDLLREPIAYEFMHPDS